MRARDGDQIEASPFRYLSHNLFCRTVVCCTPLYVPLLCCLRIVVDRLPSSLGCYWPSLTFFFVLGRFVASLPSAQSSYDIMPRYAFMHSLTKYIL
ncbi:uncharacterized protein SCHCODRAFT_02319004 [Schizophyllum commune H4-8]|uniref:uncharacterized protein n=1 Tax=Schizophyllum commune (strain H4-8 / FGSC 9210) TaxID=578458 RepID=UPI00215EFD54|nr:uncharacterized protein SCHCODRAFT_02319004 [Schizophyllum commune H4-8]KAI5891415.1 hypothetical protein SCHCODRAFT_02319004 [Schizophyllum commune H4-8]